MFKNEASSYEGEASLCYTRLLKSVDKITNLQNNHTLDLLNSDYFKKKSVYSDVIYTNFLKANFSKKPAKKIFSIH